jgi:SAM-dependent methyltransferase
MSHVWLHHALMADTVRLRAMKRALREVIRPGDVVVDLGAGTGILGFMALRAGAARVYAIEKDPILRIARALAAENGLDGRMTFLETDSRRVRLPERADVVLGDYVAHLGIEGEMAEAMADARRFLRPGGRFVPERSELWTAPAFEPVFWGRHARAGSGLGLKLRAFHALASNRIGFLGRMPRRLLAPLQRAAVFDLRRDPPKVFPRRARLRFRTEAGTVHGLIAQVAVQFSPSVRMDGTFGAHWRPVFLPLAEPLEVRRGARLVAEIVYHSAGNIEWSVEGRRQSNLFERYVSAR